MNHYREITTIQAAAILISTIIGVGVLPLPHFAVRGADTGAPLLTLMAIFVAYIGLWIITKLGMRFPQQTIIQYSEDIIGKWPARLISLIIIFFFAELTALTAREFGEVVITSVLKNTPLEVTVVVMLLMAAIAARNDMTAFTYIHHLYLPIIVGPAILIVMLSMKNTNLLFLQPFWGNEPQGMVHGILVVAALFQGFFIHSIVIPYMRRPHQAMKASFWGMFIAGGLYFLIVIATVSVFGPEEMELMLWPTLELAKTTTLPGNILERLDAAFLAVWVTAVFTTLFTSFYFTIHSLSKLLRLRDHKLLSPFMLPLFFILAMLPRNILHMYEVIENVGQIGLALTIIYPLLLLVVAGVRKVRGSTDNEQTMETSP